MIHTLIMGFLHEAAETVAAGARQRRAGPRIASPSDYLAVIDVPITSPEITSSTRRFCCRPSAVLLEATG